MRIAPAARAASCGQWEFSPPTSQKRVPPILKPRASERQTEIVSKVRGALTYPIIIMVVGTGIMGFLVSYVVPQVATIFEQTKQALPLTTQILIAFSGFLATYWMALLIGVIAIAAG